MIAVVGVTAAACGAPGGGLRVEGRAETVAAPPEPVTSGSGRDSPSVDEIRVLREDPGVGPRVRAAIARPCSNGAFGGWYPVYTRYTTVGGAGTVVTINVAGCKEDAVACAGSLASFVYRLRKGRAERVFASAEAGSRVVSAESGLRLVRPVFASGDGDPCPGATRETPLRWDGTRFVEAGR